MNTQTITNTTNTQLEKNNAGKTTLTVAGSNAQAKVFSTVDMWNIQRQRKSFYRRSVA